MRLSHRSAGFTVPELVVAIVLLFVLLLAAGYVLRPQTHQDIRYEAHQRLNMATLLQAINQYQADHQGALPDGIGEQYTFVGTQDGQVDLCKALVPAYLPDIPLDMYTGAKAYSPPNQTQVASPQDHEQSCQKPHMIYMSGYAIAQGPDGRVHVAVLAADQQTPVLSLSQP